jgi:hypothetical protein
MMFNRGFAYIIRVMKSINNNKALKESADDIPSIRKDMYTLLLSTGRVLWKKLQMGWRLFTCQKRRIIV